MGRARVNTQRSRYIVKMTKITDPNGVKKARAVIAYDLATGSHLPETRILNELLPKIDEAYFKLVRKIEKEGLENLQKHLEVFFSSVAKIAVIGGGLIEVMAEDFGVEHGVIAKEILNTSWFRQLLSSVNKDFRKVKKEDPVKYAESVSQLVELFGMNNSLSLLNRNGIRMRRSTAAGLDRVARYPPKVKNLIGEGELLLTIAFELPRVGDREIEEIAERLTSKSYKEAKEQLKNLRASHG